MLSKLIQFGRYKYQDYVRDITRETDIPQNVIKIASKIDLCWKTNIT